MAGRYAAALLAVIAGVTLVSAQIPNPGNSRSQAGTPPTPQALPPDPPPLPPDVKAPDPVSPAPDSTQNPVTRTLKKLAPNCINGIFHACWSARPQKPQPPQTDERKGAASRDVGEFYFEHKNYSAAKSRFQEALDYNPGDARAMFDLAQTLEKQNHADDAAEGYKACFELQPDGPYAERAQKAMGRLLAQQNASSKPPRR